MQRAVHRFVLPVGFLFVSAFANDCFSADRYRYMPIADCHMHLLDFLQNGDFWADGWFVRGNTQNQTVRPAQRIEAVLRIMDHANVTEAMISGMPFVKKWSRSDPGRGGYYLDTDSRVVCARDTDYTIAEALLDYRRTRVDAPAQLARLHPFLCGFDATDLGAVDRIGKTIKAYPGLWKGIGEVMSRHDDLTNLTTGERPSADHPALRRIYDFAGETGMPVSLHHNIAPISPSGQFKDPAYLPELLVCIEEHPKTVFIWCHAGISRRIVIKDLPGILDDLLTKHGDHVYIDLSWVVLDDYVMKDLRTWAALIEKHPGNFMIGSDIVGNYQGYVSTIRAYDKLLGALEREETIERVAFRNFTGLMPAEGITLPADYKYSETQYTRNMAATVEND